MRLVLPNGMPLMPGTAKNRCRTYASESPSVISPIDWRWPGKRRAHIALIKISTIIATLSVLRYHGRGAGGGEAIARWCAATEVASPTSCTK